MLHHSIAPRPSDGAGARYPTNSRIIVPGVDVVRDGRGEPFLATSPTLSSIPVEWGGIALENYTVPAVLIPRHEHPDNPKSSVTDAASAPDFSAPFFYGANRPGAKVSQGLRDSFWLQGMMAGLNAEYDCVKAFSETDQTEDLKKFDVATLILHGDDDQTVPIAASGLLSSKIVKGSILKVIPGAPHGMVSTLKNQINEELLTFFKHSKEAAA